jgi:hypothetical protein
MRKVETIAMGYGVIGALQCGCSIEQALGPETTSRIKVPADSTLHKKCIIHPAIFDFGDK